MTARSGPAAVGGAADRGATPTEGLARPLSSGLRWLLRAAIFLTFVAGLQLFALSERTDEWFSWTIAPALTAAFLGCFYWAALALVAWSSMQVPWSRARPAVAAVLVVSSLLLAATLLHFDRFHNDLFGWFWVVVYVAIPPAAIVLFALQVRRPGGDAPPGPPMPAWLRIVLGAQAAVMAIAGALLFVAPDATKSMWPWMLTPLTARAIAAWLLGIATAAALLARKGDTRDLPGAALAYVVLGTLGLVAIARYGDTISFDDAAGPLLVAFLASMIAVGAVGWVAARTGRREPGP